MGFQDRDYYREGSQSVYITSMVIKLIIINGIVFLAELLFGGGASIPWLAVHPDTIVRPLLWWQFLTAGFVHDPFGIRHIFFNMLGLYFFGQRLEDRFGRWEFLRFYLIAIVLGFVAWSASHYVAAQRLPDVEAAAIQRSTCFGASGGVTAVIVLFCALYPRATVLASFLFPIPAWLLGVVIVVSNVMGSSGESGVGPRIAYDVHLAGAVFALAYWYFGWNFGRLPGMDDFQRLVKAPRKWFQPQPTLKVHDPEQYYEDLDAEADQLLAKVKRDGLDSLTDKERRVLEDYSRRTRQKLR